MNFEPQKFFVGLIDFFSILLPGAVLTYLLMGDIGHAVLGNRYGTLEGWEAAAVFVVFSYVVGHFTFLAGAWLLDAGYDYVRKCTPSRLVVRLARGEDVPRLMRWLPRLMRRLAAWIAKPESDTAVERATELKRKALESFRAATAMNTFQWCKALLIIESPASLAVVQRFEADSKFFRSLIIVLVVLAVVWFIKDEWTASGAAIALTPLATWRYMEQRSKATNQACWSVITFMAQRRDLKLEPPTGSLGLTHAGGVVYRTTGETTYLLVESSEERGVWVLPKGHIEAGEQPAQTAVREVFEESGTWASVRAEIKRSSFVHGGATHTVQYFLMEAVSTERAIEARDQEWLPFAEAIQRVLPAARQVLHMGHLRRQQLAVASDENLDSTRSKMRVPGTVVAGSLRDNRRTLRNSIMSRETNGQFTAEFRRR